MIISNLTGGLGNQMFQYALGRYLAIKNKTVLKLHFTNALFNTPKKYELAVFNIQATIASEKDLKTLGVVKNRIFNRILYLADQRFGISLSSKIITDRFPIRYNPSILDLPDNVYLQGYWADFRYFNEIENVLRNDFTFKKKLDEKNQEILDLIEKTNSVSVHVRRGDYVTNKRNSKSLLDLDYYAKSIEYMANKIKSPYFFVFSDDIPWCEKNFKFPYEIYFVKHNQDSNSYKDMLLMSQCKNNIIANSTFSIWASWLNKNKNKIIITPKDDQTN